MKLRAVPAEKGFDQADYNASPEGKARRKKYRHDSGKWITDAKYLGKKFVGVDGEGYDLPDGSHAYVELGISGCKPLQRPGESGGISTKEALDYLWSHLSENDNNVIYGGGYDFNMWLKDIHPDDLRYIYSAHYLSKPLEVFGYELSWARGKSFTIANTSGRRRKIVIEDVASNFQCPFIDALDQYLVTYKGRDILVKMKAKRGSFTDADRAEFTKYNGIELDRLVELMEVVRESANNVHLRPRTWDGPGAFVNALFRRERIKDHMDQNVPAGPAEAARFAYAGGRFEMLKYGSVKGKGKIYEYDVNSAYPTALANVPSLANGEWIRRTGDPGDLPFALYHVRYRGTDKEVPGPIFVRSEKGTISYPLSADNWCWSPEMSSLRDYCTVIPGAEFEVIDCWEFRPAPGAPKPFGFVPALYAMRQALKKAKDGAQMILKLVLNSMYGKTAQQVGWIPQRGTGPDDPNYRPLRKPPYHQIEWAGYATSHCRATVLRAALQKPHSVIAFETDALFTSEPLDLEIAPGLGNWEVTVFLSLTYVQSGHYYGTKLDDNGNSEEVVKCRGVDKGTITRKRVENTLRQPESARILRARITRFYGAGVALMRGVEGIWCRWKTEPKNLSLFPTGKRVHIVCAECIVPSTGELSEGLRKGVWHTTVCPVRPAPGEDYCVSHEFPVGWINPNPNMTELDEMRRHEPNYDV